MVESKLVELVVAGSNPVGHPIFNSSKLVLSVWSSLRHVAAVYYLILLKKFMVNALHSKLIGHFCGQMCRK